MAEKNREGRPLKFRSVAKLQLKIDEYFESCFEEVWREVAVYNENQEVVGTKWIALLDRFGNIRKEQTRPFTVSGLALFLGTNRQTLLDYQDKVEFADTITRAKTKIENYTEEQLFDKNARNINGIQFNLNNNYRRWTNKQEMEHSGNLVIFTSEDKLED